MRSVLNHKIATVLVVALLGAVPSIASAATRKFHPSICQVVPGSTGTLNFDTSSGQIKNTGTGPLTLWCPLVNDAAGILTTTVAFQGWSVGCTGGSEIGIKARVCFASANGGNTACGAFSPTAGNCTSHLVNTSVATVTTAADDYPFLEVVIQAPNPGNNTFFGYTITGQ